MIDREAAARPSVAAIRRDGPAGQVAAGAGAGGAGGGRSGPGALSRNAHRDGRGTGVVPDTGATRGDRCDGTPVTDDGAQAERAVRSMFDEHAPAVFAFVARRVGRELAHDVTADTFRAALESIDAFDAARGSARAWLLGIAANHVRRHWRTERRRLVALGRLPAPAVDDTTAASVARLDAQRTLPGLLARIAELPDDDRNLLTLIAWEGLSYRDAALALAIPAGTVASRLNRIRSVLAEGDHDDA